MSAPLLPCPFCGTKPYISQPMKGAKWWEISCSDEDCGAMGQSCPDIAEAVAVWNRRTPPPQDPARVTEEMVNAADGVLSRSRPGIPDEVIRLAIAAALAASEGSP